MVAPVFKPLTGVEESAGLLMLAEPLKRDQAPVPTIGVFAVRVAFP
jgi:hypothetical protein